MSNKNKERVECSGGFEQLDHDFFTIVKNGTPWTNSFSSIYKRKPCKHAFNIEVNENNEVIGYEVPHLIEACSGSDPGLFHLCLACAVEASEGFEDETS